MAQSKQEQLKETYQLFFDCMLDMKFPLEKVNSFVPQDVMGYGTTIDERIVGLDEFMNLVNLQRKQFEGKIEFIRKPIFERLSKDGNTAVFVEEISLTMKLPAGDHVIPLRVTSILSYDSGKWQLVHWHGSQALDITDDTWHKEEWKQKNEALQKLVDEKTADLEIKNRELKIEASLERVRAVAMGMQEASDLLAICKVLYDELLGLGVNSLRNTMVNLNDDDKALLENYDYGGKSRGERTIIPYDSHPATKNMVNKLKKSSKAFGQFALTGKKLEEWRDYRKKLGEKDDPKLQSTKKLSYYFYSIGTGSIGISTYIPISEEQLALLKRFRNVFELAYRRYTDIQQAEELAREAKIEAALEKVRARTMAMQHSSELPEAANLLFLEIQALGIPAWSCGYNILAEDENSVMCWMSSEGQVQSGFHLPFTNTGEKSFPQWKKAIEDKTPFLVQELGGKDIQEHYDYMRTLPGLEPVLKELDAAGLELPTYQINHLCFFNGGFLLFITYEQVPEAHDLFKRFTKVFEQTFTRFLDLQKAEAQAREAQIEAALERIRSKAMAMHKSEELANLSLELVKQVQNLGEATWFCAFNIYDDDPQGSLEWGSNGEGTFPQYRTPREGVFLKYYEAGQRGESLLINEIGPDECPAHYEYLCSLPGVGDQLLKMKDAGISFPASQIDHVAYFNYGYVLFITYKPVPELHEIFKRFAKVFEQAYTRFLDLQKAEAQAREAQIETALERVRSRTMAMYSSDELAETASVLFQQLRELGLPHERTNIGIVDETNNKIDFWVTTQEGNLVEKPFPARIEESNPLAAIYKAYTQGKKSIVIEQEGAELKEWITYITKQLGIPFKPPVKNERRLQNTGFFSRGMLIATSTEHLNSEELKILERFAAVFDQTYTRFLDLQKAEEQTRESEIQLAFERVRARAMAMHKSEELIDVSTELRTQMGILGQEDLEVCAIHLYEEDEEYFESWGAMKPPGGSGELFEGRAMIPKKGLQIVAEMLSHYQAGSKDYVLVNEGEKGLEWLNAMKKYSPEAYEKIAFKIENTPPEELRAYWSIADFSGGALVMVTYTEPDENSRSLLRRSADVFDLAYKRYIDLKNNEASAREALVEAALERVRSQAMAMTESTDLLDIVVTMRTEFVNLGHEAGYFWYMRWQEKTYEKAMTSGDGTRIGMVMELPRSIHGEIPLIANWEQSDRPTVVYPMDADTAIDYVDKMISLGDFKAVDPNAPTPDDIRHIGGITFIMARTTYGEIGYSLNGVVEDPPAEDLAVLVRFASVFDLAYRRFEDLQVAEAQRKAATKQSSLDRVRAEIASMRNPADLERITPLLWRELQTLGVPFFRCGVFIVDEKEEMVHAYLSTPKGESIAALHLEFNDPDIPLVASTLKYWRLQQPFTDKWSQKQFIASSKLFLEKGQISDTRTFQAGEAPPEQLVLQLVPFKQGMLYAGSALPLDPEHIDLLKDLARAFAVAYSRYEDFILLEEAKKRVENTLSDLKAAQNQLIHAEKMASLGELTAGIAHEIQNPLNFVNNFSEINKELMDELLEELSKGDLEEVRQIARDIVENEHKIVHHGKRAEGIVKGMLQHSRSSSGKKELTDINELADEYMRLSYHGLRAKDKSFNADFEARLDDALPKVKVVPQDIGRVLLNLINNAFQAVNGGENPEVIVSTKKQVDKVEIIVQDNGPGIPIDIRDKIFQPFFTTKPTGEGTGLGLSLSYDIVKAHNGKLSVESGEAGTIFKIEIPSQ